jgi:TPR repeat protein
MSGCTNRAAGLSEAKPNDMATQACAVDTYAKVCGFDDPWACTMYAFHLSRGIGVAPDPGKALQVLEKSCKYGPDDQACIYGERVRRDIQNQVSGTP